MSGFYGVSWAADRPTFGRFLAGLLVVGALPGGCAGRPARAVLGGFGGFFLAAVDDDLLGLGCGVAPSYELGEVVAVALVG